MRCEKDSAKITPKTRFSYHCFVFHISRVLHSSMEKATLIERSLSAPKLKLKRNFRWREAFSGVYFARASLMFMTFACEASALRELCWEFSQVRRIHGAIFRLGDASAASSLVKPRQLYLNMENILRWCNPVSSLSHQFKRVHSGIHTTRGRWTWCV